MSSPAPSRISEHAAPASNTSIRRSFTLPAKIANKPRPHASSTSTGSAAGIETLFTCASTKIVSFTAASPSRQVSSSRRQSAGLDTDTPGSIPWTSVTERTLAVGVLQIYRVTSSYVSFLNSGNLLHTIFPKSQCWCVDGECRFVLRIRQDSYYRIELPYESDEDKQKIEEFKTVLCQVLQYEKTRCPFTREFEVQIPERPKTPPRRQPRKPAEKAKKWMFDKTWVPEASSRPSTPVIESSDSGTTSSYEEDDRSSINTDTNEAVSKSPVTPPNVISSKLQPPPSVRERTRSFQGTRSVTAPTGLHTRFPASSRMPVSEPKLTIEDESQTAEKVPGAKEAAETLSHTSSADSFYSLEAATQCSPSPPYVDAEAELLNPWSDEPGQQKDVDEGRGRGRHRRQISEITVRAHSSGNIEDAHPRTPTGDIHPSLTPTVDIQPSSAPSTPPLMSDSEDSLESPSLDVATPPDNLRLKRLTGASQRRAFSPMPHPQNLFCAPNRSQGKQFTAALVRKTCELILGPPAHLVQLMLNIAARITNEAFGFNRVRHAGERIPCSWESDDDDWAEEDDFGIPLGNFEGSTLRRRACSGEVD